jgi:hypothetical protein
MSLICSGIVVKYASQVILAITLSCSLFSGHAATTFITNNSSSKTLASNESDAGVGLTNGTDNDGLHLDTVGDSTVLTLSVDDGGGAITFTTTAIAANNNLFMDSDSMGHGNDKWGHSQNWTFSLDKTISFDAIDMFSYNETMYLQSSAWVGDANTSGTGWTFDGTTGTFSLLGSAGTDPLFDFTSAGVSDVAAGTDIFFGYTGSAGGGEQMRSFTITVIPEPSTALLLGLGGGLLCLLRRRR